MRTRRILPLLIAAALVSVTRAAPACPDAQPLGFLGNAEPMQSAPDQVIVIDDGTRYVNVTSGTTVRFVVGERFFTWNFETGGTRVIPFDLERIAPEGFLRHRVVAYVADDPLYQG